MMHNGRDRPAVLCINGHPKGIGCCAYMCALMDQWWKFQGGSAEEHRHENKMLRHERACEQCAVALVVKRLEQ